MEPLALSQPTGAAAAHYNAVTDKKKRGEEGTAGDKEAITESVNGRLAEPKTLPCLCNSRS